MDSHVLRPSRGASLRKLIRDRRGDHRDAFRANGWYYIEVRPDDVNPDDGEHKWELAPGKTAKDTPFSFINDMEELSNQWRPIEFHGHCMKAPEWKVLARFKM